MSSCGGVIMDRETGVYYCPFCREEEPDCDACQADAEHAAELLADMRRDDG